MLRCSFGNIGAKVQSFWLLAVERDNYACGFALFGSELMTGDTRQTPLSLTRQGNSSVLMSFSNALPHTFMMVRMLVYGLIVKNNHHRQIVADFTI